MASQQSHSFAKQLVTNGTLAQTNTKSGHPRYFYTLPRSRADFARSLVSEHVHYNKYMLPLKISQDNYGHEFFLKHLSMQAMKKCRVQYIPQSQLAIRHSAGAKVTDALGINPDQVGIGVEVELSQKFGRVVDNSIFAIIQSPTYGEYDCNIFSCGRMSLSLIAVMRSNYFISMCMVIGIASSLFAISLMVPNSTPSKTKYQHFISIVLQEEAYDE